MRECVSCRAANPDDADFCSACGAVIPIAAGGPQGTIQSGMAPDSTPSPVYPGGAVYYGSPHQQPPYPAVMTVNSNGKAIASLVLAIFGIASCPIVCSIIALILGVQARREIAASGGWQTGDNLARAGIILAWVGIGLYVLLILFIVIVALASPDSFSLPQFGELLTRI